MITRKINIDLELRGSTEADLDVIEEQLRNKFAEDEWIEERIMTTRLRCAALITASKITSGSVDS